MYVYVLWVCACACWVWLIAFEAQSNAIHAEVSGLTCIVILQMGSQSGAL